MHVNVSMYALQQHYSSTWADMHGIFKSPVSLILLLNIQPLTHAMVTLARYIKRELEAHILP